ncbi:ethanolaminephosphotransferase 1-like isoform X2 [Photinus pyralis]|nr:ethanolaminephosphotransferase 1-like isoform X2 [Photinus pyralis]XP_031328778.1 ethanolaminephosphotransferase 1-like isoform X2 [Photinus pyralis]
MHPYWNCVVEYCPKWVAPNLLTFIGFLFAVGIFLLFTIMDYYILASDDDYPDVSPLPKWTFIVAAIFMFVAYTLDGIDGKQARRTGSSSPLGELFDHGIDSYTASLIPITVFSVFGRGEKFSLNSYHMYFLLWNILINFHLCHWEKYNTGVLFLPWGYDITMCITVIMFIITGIWGYQMWQFVLPGGITLGKLLEIIIYGTALLSNLPTVLWNVYLSYKDRTGYGRSLLEALRPFSSVVIFFLICMGWVLNSPGQILDTDPRPIFFITGTIFSNICCRLIVAQMSSSRSEAFNMLLIPTALVTFLSVITRSARLEFGLAYSLCVFVALAHVHYGCCVVRQMCRHFRINCFSLKPHAD